jgi:hypothetical protein
LIAFSRPEGFNALLQQRTVATESLVVQDMTWKLEYFLLCPLYEHRV